MTKLLKSFVISLFLLSGVACSNQYRSADAGTDDVTVVSQLQEAMGRVGGTSAFGLNANNRVEEIFNDPNSTVFYAASNEVMGPVETVLAFYDYSFLSPTISSSQDIDEARAFFLDLPAQDGSRESALILEANVGGSWISEAFFQTQEAEYGEMYFHTVLQSGSGVVLDIYSKDVFADSGELAGVIQLEIWIDDPANGQSGYLGKVSSMVGFGG